MTDKEKKLLTDIIYAIELIESFTSEINSFNVYLKDIKTKSAVERQLSIVGEALNKFIKETAFYQIENASQIVSLRNRIIHSYDNIDDAIIWAILTRHVEPLKKQVILLLKKD